MKSLLFLLSAALLVSTAVCQDRFDIATFERPSGWTSDQRPTVWTFSTTDNKTGRYCVLGLYQSTDSKGDPLKDFEADWQDLVSKPLNISDTPQKSEGSPKDGFHVWVGAGTYVQNNVTGLAILTSMSNGTRAISIVTLTNDTTYLADYRKFYSRLKLAGTGTQQTTNTKPVVGTLPVLSGSFDDYMYSLPPGWKSEKGDGMVVLRGPDNYSVLTIFPMRKGSGNLEADMQSIFWEVFDGWQVDRRNIDHHIYAKGVSPNGWEYYRQELGISKIDNPDMEIYGFVFLANVGGKEAVIAGTYVNTTDLLAERGQEDWQLFYHSLDFKGYQKPKVNPLSSALLGSWRVGSYSGMVTYDFAANGHYASGSAFSTSNRVDDYTIKETTTSFVGDGTYVLNGNQLTMTNAKTGKVQTAKVRIFDEREFTDEWITCLGMLETSIVDGTLYEVVLRIVKN